MCSAEGEQSTKQLNVNLKQLTAATIPFVISLSVR